MRQRLLGAIFGFGLVATFASQDVPAINLETAPDTNPRYSLADDEAYRRDGAVTTIRSCLAVADDPKVRSIWSLQAFRAIRRLPENEMAKELVRLGDEIKLRPGFGTILACAQVIAGWYAETVGTNVDDPFVGLSDVVTPKDGRIEHGSLVIDLSIDHQRRAFIDPVPLARLLTSPELLPPSAYGGIVLRNAIINGPLLFHNLHLTNPLAFVNVKFAGRSYSKKLFDIDERITRTAMAINYSRFDDHLFFSRSTFCGHVRINDSHFEETVTFQEIAQRDIGCRTFQSKIVDDEFEARLLPDLSLKRLLEPKRPPPRLDLNNSAFAQGLTVVRSVFGTLKIAGGMVNSFASAKSYFGSEMRIIGVDIDSLQIDCSVLAEDAELSYNVVKKDLLISGTGNDADCGSWWREQDWLDLDFRSRLNITSNRIGGGLGLDEFDRTVLEPPLNLGSNRVGNGSYVILPSPDRKGRPWRGQVNFSGSTYEGKLHIGVGKRLQKEAKVPSRPALDAYCLPTNEIRPTGAVLEFRAAKIRTISWNLPLTCDYRWLGFGFTYDLWLPGPIAKSPADLQSPDPDREALQRWRLTLGRYQSASLGIMSRYLEDKGAYVESRDVLLEAKRLNYAPTCRPNSSLFDCAAGLLSTSADRSVSNSGKALAAASIDEGGLADGDADVTDDGSFLHRLRDSALVVLLGPGGYGAKPEWALFSIFVAAGGFFAVYRLYSLGLLYWLKDVPALKHRLTRIQHIDGDQRNPRSTIGLKEGGASAGFIHASGDISKSASEVLGRGADAVSKLEDLIVHWPSQLDWERWSVRRRLYCIQTMLLPRIESCRNDADEPLLTTLQDLKKELERFGSTQTLGFSLFDDGKKPTRFTHWRYSIDTMVPFIDLHAYSNYYPEWGWMRFISVVQHVIGWWLMTVFVASAAIL